MNVVDIGVFEAKTRLSELIDRVEHGQVFRITRRGRPIAELRPIAATVSQLHFGVDHGRVQVGDDFDAPLPEFARVRGVRLLADTQAFLWHMSGDGRLSQHAREALDAPDSEWFLSVASVWEMAIKAGTARLTLPAPTAVYVAEKVKVGLKILPVDWTHAAAVAGLPLHHRDPFDRVLIAQAQAERLTMVTSDPMFERYGVEVIW